MALASTFFYLKTKPAAVIPRLSRSELFYPFIIPFWFHIPNAKQILLLWLIQSTVFFKVDACDGCKWISVSGSSNGERRQRCVVRIIQVGIAGSKFFCT
jgi:hypothetical protein